MDDGEQVSSRQPEGGAGLSGGWRRSGISSGEGAIGYKCVKTIP